MKTVFSQMLPGARRFLLLLTVFLLLLPSSARAQVTGMRVGSGAARIRIVLDLDSPTVGRFTQADRAGLEVFVRVLEKAIFP